MSPFTTLRRTYSALSYSLSSSDEVHSDDLEDVVSQPRKLNPRTISRYSFLIRVAIFIALESGFIALVSTALRKPIFLHLSFTITEVKSAVTAIAILWHSIAVVVVKDILLNIFSAEWMDQHDTSRSLTLQELDIVSRLTTGFIDQVKYCVSKRATRAFRLGFLTSLLLVLLSGPVGPSAISVNYAPYVYPHTIQAANLNDQFIESGFLVAMPSRIKAIIELEAIGHSTNLGFSGSQPNVLIPWPSSESISENITIRYSSDVIRTNFSCSWNEPSLGDLESTQLNIANHEWSMQASFDTVFPGLAFAYPLVGSQDYQSFIAFLLGDGLSFAGPRVNLEGIPSVLLPCNMIQNGTYIQVAQNSTSVECELITRVSALVCNPQIEILPAIVTATASSLEATILPAMPTAGSIPIEVANYVLLYSSILAGWEDDSTIASRLFFHTSDDNDSPQAGGPLSLPAINHNMTNFMASATKAYLSGYPDFAMVNTSGEIEVQKMALVGSEVFFGALTVTVSLLVPMLSALVVMTRPDQLECFDLENIVRRLQISYFSDSTS